MRPHTIRGLRKGERGSVFVLTLAVLVAHVGLIATLAATNREYSRSQANRLAERRARLMVEAGVQRAVAELQQQGSALVTLQDRWASLGARGDERFLVGRDSFQLQVLDLSARVNLNTADRDQIRKLALSEEQTDSLLDWREQSPTARPEGAKDSFYNRLPNPYSAKQKPFDSLDELLQVRGFSMKEVVALEDAATVDSTSADKDIQGKQKLDLNAASRDQLLEIGVPQALADAILQAKGSGFKSMRDVLQVKDMTLDAARTLADNATVGNEAQQSGRINLNTAPEAVLSTVPDLDAVQAILDRQRSGFRSLGEMLDLPGMSLGDFAKLVDRFCVGSSAFLVRVIGSAAGRHFAAEAVLTLDANGEAHIKRIQPVLYPVARDTWNWPSEPGRSTTL